MLRSFRVANHRSIRTEQELLLMPAYDKTRPVVPVAGIFGANAAGKSNLLDALRFMQHAVIESYTEWKPGTGIPRTPFKLDAVAAAEPSVYVVELLLDGVRHIYGFEIDDEKVREEWLYAYPRNRRRVIFDREEQQIRLGSTVAEYRSRGALLADLTRRNTLFLSAAAHLNMAEILPLYEWFRSRMTVVDAGLRANRHTLTERLLPAAPDRSAAISLLRAADLGISDVIVDPAHLELLALSNDQSVLKLDPDELMDKLKGMLARHPAGSPLHFVHGEGGATLNLEEESEGTRAWMAMIDLLLDGLKEGSVLVVDEIDSSLHPRLTARLLDVFQNPEMNPRGAQLILTTHDAVLLSPLLGDDPLARDQIWFVEKDQSGATTLIPLTDFHPRKDENTERRYLGGGYGAVPMASQYAFMRALEAVGMTAASPGAADDGAA